MEKYAGIIDENGPRLPFCAKVRDKKSRISVPAEVRETYNLQPEDKIVLKYRRGWDDDAANAVSLDGMLMTGNMDGSGRLTIHAEARDLFEKKSPGKKLYLIEILIEQIYRPIPPYQDPNHTESP